MKFNIDLTNLDQADDILFNKIGCDKNWIGKLKKLDLNDGDKCKSYFDSLQQKFLEICTMMEENKNEMDTGGGKRKKSRYDELKDENNRLENVADKIGITLHFSVFYFLCAARHLPNDIAVIITNNVMDEVGLVPVFWNALNKTRDFLFYYSYQKTGQPCDYSEMEKANQYELLDCLDILTDLLGVSSSQNRIMN